MMAYFLLSITGAGLISSVKFDTLAACQDARSLALYGETRAEKARRDAAFGESERVAREKWYAEHPPRAPETDDEKRLVSDLAKNIIFLGWSYRRVVPGGLIQDDFVPAGHGVQGLSWAADETLSLERGQWIKRGPSDVIKAYCLAEVPGEPTP